MQHKDYHADMDYPSVDGLVPNPCEAACLVEDYGGRNSETTAIMQYVYQHYIFGQDFPDIARMLKGVAIVEMHHHALLGEAVVRLGGDPVIGGRHCFWSGSSVNYCKNIVTALQNDIVAERAAIAEYRATICRVQSPALIAVLERIICDEEVHIGLFIDALESLSAVG